ncbi:MAG: hypothetical protein DHS20C18_32100 [Saprospiraceae bacterium]|nr:MAG: hypothetical protein DHS20C18_32100 [Saprospiraceae bacterium]
MKLRCTRNSIRIRLRKSELEQLKKDKHCTEVMYFPGQRVLTFGIFIRSVTSINVSLHDNQIQIVLPEIEAEHWIETDQVGMETQLALSKESFLHVLVEKDFPCKDRADEDKSDTFEDLANKNQADSC